MSVNMLSAGTALATIAAGWGGHRIRFAPDDGGGGGGASALTGGGAPAQQQQTPPAGGGGEKPAGQQQQAPTAGGWFGKMTEEDRAWAASKGWKDEASADPLAIIQSYRNLESLFGADKAGQTLRLPKDANDKAAMDAIFDKLGRPKDAAGYEIKLPDGADTKFADTAKQWFHKAGLTKDQASAVSDAFSAYELDQVQARDAAHEQELTALRQEWGAEYDRRIETAKAALKAANLGDEHARAIEIALGPAVAARIFEFFGRNYLEASAPGGEARSVPGFGQLTPKAADQKMKDLYADKAFMDRYNHFDPKVRAGAMQEMEALAKLAANSRMG